MRFGVLNSTKRETRLQNHDAFGKKSSEDEEKEDFPRSRSGNFLHFLLWSPRIFFSVGRENLLADDCNDGFHRPLLTSSSDNENSSACGIGVSLSFSSDFFLLSHLWPETPKWDSFGFRHRIESGVF